MAVSHTTYRAEGILNFDKLLFQNSTQCYPLIIYSMILFHLLPLMPLNSIYMIFANRLALQKYDMYSPGQFPDLSLVHSKKSWQSTTFCSSCKDLQILCKFLHFITGAMKKEKSFHVPSVFSRSRFKIFCDWRQGSHLWKLKMNPFLLDRGAQQWEHLFFLEFSDRADLSYAATYVNCCICLFALMKLKGVPYNIGLLAI